MISLKSKTEYHKADFKKLIKKNILKNYDNYLRKFRLKYIFFMYIIKGILYQLNLYLYMI